MMTSLSLLILFIFLKCLVFFWEWLLRTWNSLHLQRYPEPPSEFQNSISQGDYQKSQEYTGAKIKYANLSDLYDLTLLLFFILIGGFGWLEAFCVQAFSNTTAQGILFCFIILFGKALLDLPWEWAYTFGLEQRFGFNRETPRVFWGDFLKKGLLSLVLGLPVMTFLYILLYRFSHSFAFWGWLGCILFQGLLMGIYPTLIAPLFNRFNPLTEGDLKKSIYQLTQQLQFQVANVFVIDGSTRSTHANAYFAGLGKHRRIVLFDTLMETLEDNEIVGVLAHEIGHNRLKHIWKSFLLSAVYLGLGFFFLDQCVTWQSLYQSFGMTGRHVFPVLVLFPMVCSPLLYWSTPLWNMFSRKNEYEADAFAVQATRKPNDLAQALMKLGSTNFSNLTPHPTYSFFHYSHPSLLERLKAIENVPLNPKCEGNHPS